MSHVRWLAYGVFIIQNENVFKFCLFGFVVLDCVDQSGAQMSSKVRVPHVVGGYFWYARIMQGFIGIVSEGDK